LLVKVHFITSLTLLYVFAVDAFHSNEGKVMCFKYLKFSCQSFVWDVTTCSLVGSCQHFGGTCCLLLHGRGCDDCGLPLCLLVNAKILLQITL
jgi:hypothetical protein